MKIVMSGLDKVVKALEELTSQRSVQASNAAIRVEAESIMTRSKKEFVPKRMGILMNSGTVSDVKKENDDVFIELGYGGAASAYAVPVHENPSQFDPPTWKGVEVEFHPEGRSAKFLQIPYEQAQDGMLDRIADRIKKGIKK